MPDSSESRERAVPAKEAGLGQMGETSNTPVSRPPQHNQTRQHREQHRELTADETTDQRDAVSPTDAAAHGGTSGVSEAEATGKVRRSESERQVQRDADRQRGGR